VQHEQATRNHKIESWTFVDQAAREAGTGMSPTPTSLDIGRIAFQQSDETYWRLTAASPIAWTPLGSGGSGVADGKQLVGDGPPSAGLGSNNDTYFDRVEKKLYGPKAGGSWGSGSATANAADGRLRTGTGAPSAGLGADGDTYFDKSAKVLYEKVAGAWDAGTTVPDGKQLTGDGAPSAGLGSDGDTYFDRTTKRLYDPKAGGAWGGYTDMAGPAGPPGAGGDSIFYKASDAITIDDTARGSDLTALLRTQTHVALPVNAGNPWQEFAAPGYRIGTGAPCAVPTFASLVGRNSWLTANENVGSGAIVQLERDSSLGTGFAQSLALCLIEGVSVNGRRGQVAGNDQIVGFNLMCPDRTGVEDYIAGHSALHTSKLIATLCGIGVNLVAAQYAFHEHWRVTNCAVAVFMSGLNYGGGNVDCPDLRHWNFWGNGVGLAFQPHWNWPVSENKVIGFWAKECTTAAIAVFWDPAQTGDQIDGSRIIIEGGSTEYNVTGKLGEDVTVQYTFPRYNTNAADETFTVDIPKVDVWVQKYCRVRFTQYAFQSDTNKSSSNFPSNPEEWGRSGIICMLDGPKAILEIGPYCDFPWQQVYSVRARHEWAWVEFHGLLMSGGGIFENVRIWPSGMALAHKAPDWTFENTFAMVFSGWGHMHRVENDVCPSVLDTGYYSNAYIQAPFLQQGPGIHATTGITAGVMTEPSPQTYGGRQVGYFEFQAGVVDATARTQYLMGGATFGSSTNNVNVMKRFADAGGLDDTGQARTYWWITNVELYNTHDFPVRIMPYLDTEYSDVTVDSHTIGCSPALRYQNGSTTPRLVRPAVTLWPKQWMRVTIICNPSSDQRLNFLRLDHTADTVRICIQNLGSFRPTEHHRDFLNNALKFGYYSLR
jgi:hypothetical protein